MMADDDPEKKAAARKSGPKKAADKKAGSKKAAAKKAAAKQAAARTPPAPSAPDAPAASRGTKQPGREPVPQSLQHMPANLFGAGLGLAGFATAWREAAVAFEAGILLGRALIGVAIGVFLVLLALYAVKAMRHPDAVRAELRHPVQGNFFAAATMTAMILAAGLADTARGPAEAVWAVAAIANAAITVTIVTIWISRDWALSHMTPVWFIPAVGNLVVPITGAAFGYIQIGWMAFAVGLLFWLVLFTMLLYRLLFEPPMQPPLRPSLTILIAPPSLCFIGYAILTGGQVDGVASMFMGLAVFMALLLAPQLPAMLRQPFGLGAWSYVFPLSAFSVAATLYADAIGGFAPRALAIGTIAAVSVVTLIVTALTVRAVWAGKVFRPAEAPLPPA
jgi:tellurite resistance protein